MILTKDKLIKIVLLLLLCFVVELLAAFTSFAVSHKYVTLFAPNFAFVVHAIVFGVFSVFLFRFIINRLRKVIYAN